MALRLPLRVVLASMLASLLSPSLARAHWCDDLWDSSYNIVVKPASDTVTVPATGSATLDLYVQNNMGYALSDFQFRAEPADSTYNITSVRTVPKVSGYLMPGETLKYTLTISKAGGATLDVTTLQFYVNFGDKAPGYPQRQDLYYQDHPVMLKKHSGGLFPATISLISGNEQAQMVAAAALRITGDSSDDAGVESELIARARFTYFDDDDGKALMAAHLLNLVAWEQRGWAVGAGDTGPVSFYPENANTESGQGGGGTGSTKGGFGAGGGASLLAILLIFAARRRKT